MIRYSLAGIALVTVDQLSKYWARVACVQQRWLAPFLSCEVTTNRGCTFGLFTPSCFSYAFLQMILIASVVGAVCWYAHRRLAAGYTIWGEVCIVAGALGNVIDRLVHGAVIDFIGIHCCGMTWPLCNVADIAIVFGVGYMMMTHMKEVGHA